MTFSRGSGDDSRLRLDARVETGVHVIPFEGVVEPSGGSCLAVCVGETSSNGIPPADPLHKTEHQQSKRRKSSPTEVSHWQDLPWDNIVFFYPVDRTWNDSAVDSG